MLTIARESAAAISAANRGTGQAMLQDVEHAEAVLAKTPDMLPVLKEAVYDAAQRIN